MVRHKIKFILSDLILSYLKASATNQSHMCAEIDSVAENRLVAIHLKLRSRYSNRIVVLQLACPFLCIYIIGHICALREGLVCWQARGLLSEDPVWRFGVFFIVTLNKLLKIHSSCRWWETRWCLCAITVMYRTNLVHSTHIWLPRNLHPVNITPMHPINQRCTIGTNCYVTNLNDASTFCFVDFVNNFVTRNNPACSNYKSFIVTCTRQQWHQSVNETLMQQP